MELTWRDKMYTYKSNQYKAIAKLERLGNRSFNRETR